MAWQGSTRRQRLPDDWPARRRHVLDRDGHRCTVVVNGARCTARADDVDHIVRGDDHSYSNLASICRPHHKQKTAREAADARRRTSNRRPQEPHPGLV